MHNPGEQTKQSPIGAGLDVRTQRKTAIALVGTTIISDTGKRRRDEETSIWQEREAAVETLLPMTHRSIVFGAVRFLIQRT